jgi:hypothetical protein
MRAYAGFESGDSESNAMLIASWCVGTARAVASTVDHCGENTVVAGVREAATNVASQLTTTINIDADAEIDPTAPRGARVVLAPDWLAVLRAPDSRNPPVSFGKKSEKYITPKRLA